MFLQGAPNIVLRLCGCCEGAVYSVTSVLTQSHSAGFNLEFETLFEPIWQDLLIYHREKAKEVVASKTALMLPSSNFKTWQVFKESSRIRSEFSLHALRGSKCSLITGQHY